MSGWDGWAANIIVAGAPSCKGAALFEPGSGAVWGRSGEFDCCSGLNTFDLKADGKEATPPLINKKKFIFIRKTLDDDYSTIFKAGSDSICTCKGPSGSRIIIYIEADKPEPALNKIIDYLKPHV